MIGYINNSLIINLLSDNGGGRGIACEEIEYLFSMLFFIRGSVIFVLHKQVTNDTLGLESFEIRILMLTTVELTLAHRLRG